ncbi:MAG: hypothetical protein DRP85_03395 [Candidatus Makaraimicrobium thalassicum]|nr:MAG: hypothetical protein DRP85_03395 [Candidatus Omnitrophota bacterium]
MDRGEGSSLPPVKKRTILVSVVLIVILGFAVYGNSLDGEFLWDDTSLVKDNLYIRNCSRIGKLFSGHISTKSVNFRFYRPFQMISYVMDHSLWKADARGYHLTNLLLHIAVALAVYWLVNILFKDILLSFLTGIFFLVHPVHTEAVSYISGRSDPLAALFMLLCFIFYVKGINTGRTKFFFLAIPAYAGALLSREAGLILIILLLLYHFAFKKEIKLKGFLPLLGVTFVYIALRLTVLKGLVAAPAASGRFFQRLPGFFAAITEYTRLMALPFHLHMEYGAPLFELNAPEVIAGVLILSFALACALKKRTGNRLVFFSIFWFFVALLPVSNLYPVNAYMAEHWLYVPSIGLFLLLAKGLSYLYRRGKSRVISAGLITGILIFYSSLTFRQNTYWREPAAFYERTLRYVPDSPRLYANLGKIYRSTGRKEEAIALFEKAVELNPDFPEAYNNLGNAYSDAGRKEKAIALLKKAVTINPDYAEAYYNLGNAYNDTGRKKEALASFRKAIEANPDFSEAYNNLGKAYADTGRKEEAITFLEKAVTIDPDYAMAHNNLAVIYYDMGEYALAVKHSDMALKLGSKVHPGFLRHLEPHRNRKIR